MPGERRPENGVAVMLRRLLVAGFAVALALAPAVALAQDGGDRTGAAPGDLWRVVLMTALGLGILMVVAAVGYLYRRERGLAWDFQLPDPDDVPHDPDQR